MSEFAYVFLVLAPFTLLGTAVAIVCALIVKRGG